MLTAWDELMCHQMPATMDHVHTTNPEWTERVYVSIYNVRDKKTILGFGVGQYPNKNVQDGFATVWHEGRQYNFRAEAEFEAMGSDFFASDQPFEMPGRSCFLQAGGRVFHTYSQYARGLESTGGSYYFLDLTALGRQEEWEEPKGRSESARSATPDFAS